MKILVSKNAGFCWGVRRAMDTAVRVSARFGHRERIQTLGPLIHNAQALSALGRRGVVQVNSIHDLPGGMVVIRAHGIPQEELRFLKEQRSCGLLRYANATCPAVGRVHSIIKTWSARGYFVVILGSESHAEVVAHKSYANVHGFAVVASVEEAEALPAEVLDKVLVVAQTTFLTQDFQTIVDALQVRARELVVKNTICRETWVRQDEARALVQKVASVVVVGGKTSNNTLHLVAVAKAQGKPTQHVETALELDFARLRDCVSIGVLAGASTPNWTVDEVVEALAQHQQGVAFGPKVLRFGKVVHGAQVLALLLLAPWLHHVLGWRTSWAVDVFPALNLFGLCALAPYLEPLGLGRKGPIREAFLVRNRRTFLGWGSLALMGSWCCAWAGGFWLVSGCCLVDALFLGYLWENTPTSWLGGLGRQLGVKDLGQAFAVPFLVLLLPWLQGAQAGRLVLGLAFFGLLALALAFHAWRHLKALHEDQMIGPETLAVAIGLQPTRILTLSSLALGALVLGYCSFGSRPGSSLAGSAKGPAAGMARPLQTTSGPQLKSTKVP